jgi:leucyl-tRNA synthetase
MRGDITAQPWPGYDERFLVEDEIEIVVQVNGKLRDKLTIALDATDTDVEATALALPKIKGLLAGKTVRKVVIVPKKLVNIVAA